MLYDEAPKALHGNIMLRFFFILMLPLVLFCKEINVVFSYSTPPYVFKDGSGIVITIVKEALAHKGHGVTPVFVNIGRAFELFKHGYVDATSIIREDSGLEAFYSDYFMQYHNAAFALRKNCFVIKTMNDLARHHFIAFQNARIYLGQEFGAVAQKAGARYEEIADQKQQVYKLLMGRTDLVIMDRHIFHFYVNELVAEGKISADIETELFELFEPTRYRTAFKDEQLRDDFNEGVTFLKESGRYDAIHETYAKRYFKVTK